MNSSLQRIHNQGGQHGGGGRRWHRAWMRMALMGLIAGGAGCGVDTIAHNLDEREANQMIELLAESSIVATKGLTDTGRTVVYHISVPSKARLEAIRLLNRYEMPRRRDAGYAEIFKDAALIPTASEERAKQLAALEGEIEKQLKLVNGILDVQVQLVLPLEDALRAHQEARVSPTASVTVKYMPAAGGAKPLSEAQIQAVVAGGVERLTPDNVVVVMTPSGPFVAKAEKPEPAPSAEGTSGALQPMSKRQVNMAVVVLLGLILILSLVLTVSQIRLRTVRSRLIRLQTEIAKAQRKPLVEAPPSGS